MGGVWTFMSFLAAAVFFGWSVPLTRLFSIFQPMIVASSIMIAAILVRLNRGMPTLDWKAVAPAKRANLTAAILGLAREYVGIFALNLVLLLSLLTLSAIGLDDVRFEWSEAKQRFCSAAIGGILAISIVRLAYVVWRDYDIVRLQKKVIDEAGVEEQIELEIKSAEQKVLQMRNAGLRKIDSQGPRPL